MEETLNGTLTCRDFGSLPIGFLSSPFKVDIERAIISKRCCFWHLVIIKYIISGGSFLFGVPPLDVLVLAFEGLFPISFQICTLALRSRADKHRSL